MYLNVLIHFETSFDLGSQKVKIKPDYTVGMIMYKIREKFIQNDSKRAMFLFFHDSKTNSSLLQPTHKKIIDIYNELNKPVWIEIHVKHENTFGYKY